MLYRCTMVAMAQAGALAMTLTAQAQVLDFSKYPDIVAQWKRPPGIGIQWDQTKRVGPAQQAPLTPEYQKLYEENLADQKAGGQGADPLSRCIPFGMPRMMSIIFPMEIIIMPKTTYLLTDYTEPRRIYTDGRSWPQELEPTFNGYSIGKWVDEDGDGRYDVLEVETRGFKSPRTFEASGIQLHDDGQTVVKERIYLDKQNKDVLHDEITTIDKRWPSLTIPNYRREPSRLALQRLRREQPSRLDRQGQLL